MVHVKTLTGFVPEFHSDGRIVQSKRWDREETPFLLETVVRDLPVRQNDADLAESTVEARFRPGTRFCYLGQPGYGSIGEVWKGSLAR